MDTTITLSELTGRNVEVRAHEAVAIVQSLIRDHSENIEARPPYGPPSLESITIHPGGVVHCRGMAATPSVPEVAVVLQALLACTADRVPGGLRYAVGRALLEVEAAPFDSLDEFSSVLERFEEGDRRQTLAALHARTLRAMSANVARDKRIRAAEIERRKGGPSIADLRRALLDADLRLYEAQRATPPQRGGRGPSSASRRAPLAACMVAGVALVAAGEAAHTRRVVPVADANTRASSQNPMVQPVVMYATDSQHLPQPTDSGTSAMPTPTATVLAAAQTSDGAGRISVTPTLPAAAPRIVKTRLAATGRAGANARLANRSRAQGRQGRSREKDDRGVLARIRFEWNNPFR
jgi:hypothetical protein